MLASIPLLVLVPVQNVGKAVQVVEGVLGVVVVRRRSELVVINLESLHLRYIFLRMMEIRVRVTMVGIAALEVAKRCP
jgi:hypothetical protein